MSKTKVGKCRADVALVERGLAESRAKAQALIMAGKVFAGERKLAKPGEAVADDQPLEVRGQDHPWVSRGGLKLAHAIEHFGLDRSEEHTSELQSLMRISYAVFCL